MSNVKLIFFSLVITGLVSQSSCEDGGTVEDLPKKTGVLIVNEGNFGQGNGSVSFYDEEQYQEIRNQLVREVEIGD